MFLGSEHFPFATLRLEGRSRQHVLERQHIRVMWSVQRGVESRSMFDLNRSRCIYSLLETWTCIIYIGMELQRCISDAHSPASRSAPRYVYTLSTATNDEQPRELPFFEWYLWHLPARKHAVLSWTDTRHGLVFTKYKVQPCDDSSLDLPRSGFCLRLRPSAT